MKKSIKFIAVLSLFLFIGMTLSSCGNMRMSTSAGVNVNFGPGGPRIDPYVNVGMYSGGRRY